MAPHLAAPHPADTSRVARIDDAVLCSVVTEWDAVASVPKGLFIGGSWCAESRTLLVEDPSTGDSLCAVADADRSDCLRALAAASRAQRAWAATPAAERADVLQRAAAILEAEAERVALVVTLESGKPIDEARDEVGFASDYLRWFAARAPAVEQRREVGLDSGTARVRRTPVGPALIITPWNFPLAVPARGVAPALLAGCTVVLRPSSLTPLSALILVDILDRAGAPAGVVNCVVSSTDGATDPLIDDERLRKLTFTGSAAVGRHLARLAAGRMVRTSMELGGTAPFIVLDDADLDAAVEGAVAAKMRNGGAACTAANRFYVHASLALDFTRMLAERLSSLRLGRGTDPRTDVGPLSSRAHVERLTALVDEAVALGAAELLGGGRVGGPGAFFAPCLLVGVPEGCRVATEEIFGPVAQVAAFIEDGEVVDRVNTSRQGLAAYVYGRDITRAQALAENLDVGMVALNRGRVSAVQLPFGGTKEAGFGRSGGEEGLDEYLQTAYVTAAG